MKKVFFSFLFLISTINLFSIDGLLVQTIDNSFQEKWYNTISSTSPQIINYETIFKGQYIFISPVAWGFDLDKDNLAEVEYSIKILKPDATVYLSKENLPVISGKLANKANLQMSNAVLKIAFEEEDKYGEYKIEVTILDKVSQKTKIINSTITLKKLPPYTEFEVASSQDFSNWFTKYYEHPEPEKALSYYLYYSQSELSENDDAFYPIFSMFLEIFENNEFLYPQILHCYKKQDDKTKTYLLYLLRYSDIGTQDFYDGLKGFGKELYMSIKDESIPDRNGVITDPMQLDMLWAAFSANGSYQTILRLIKTLDYTKYQGDLDKYKTSKKTEEDRQKAINNAIYNSLVWSISSNCQQHELVLKYANWALTYEDLSEVQKIELKKILAGL